MHGHDTLVFLLSLALLLGMARLLGELARSIGLPLVVGELATGILLGVTGLRRVLPGVHAWLFPSGGAAEMLSGYTLVSVVMLLVVAGLEVDLGMVKRRGKNALLVALLGVAVPMLGGFLYGHVAPESVIGSSGQRNLFALFMGVALSISALPVIAKTLLDLGLFKTDVGLLVMTVAMFDDLIGWIAFSILLGPLNGGRVEAAALLRTIALGAVFVFLCLVPGRRLVDRMLGYLEEQADLAPGRVLSLVAVLAMIGASATQAIGLHAVLGGFLVGVTVGDSPRLKERTRLTIHQFVTNVFAPVFFASLGLRVDFFASFDPTLCLVIFFVATAAKLVGCAGGARLSGMPWREALAIGFGLNARGAMGILLALLARDAKLIDDRVFVALVGMALATSLVAGPAMKRLLYSRGSRAGSGGVDDAAALVRDGAFLPELVSSTSARAIEELGRALRPAIGDLVEPALISVLEREMVAPTGLGDDVAIPHAAVEGLKRPVVALGLSANGIDFQAPDGRPAKIVFLLLLPPKAYEKEVLVLAALARSVFDEKARTSLLATKTLEQALDVLGSHSQRIAGKSPGPRLGSLGDI
jgi:Kef-type K+ transport system membrane component KefB/mannitol/fructose-specific phosphotransferase system IIA component (Ntr-type)